MDLQHLFMSYSVLVICRTNNTESVAFQICFAYRYDGSRADSTPPPALIKESWDLPPGTQCARARQPMQRWKATVANPAIKRLWMHYFAC